MKRLIIALLGLFTIWTLCMYLRYGGVSKENINVRGWFSLLDTIQFPNLLEEYRSLITMFKTRVVDNISFISSSVGALSNSSNYLQLIKNIYRLLFSIWFLLTEPVILIFNSAFLTLKALYYVFLCFMSVSLFVFAPLFNYEI